jgi:hypothetical protein
MEQGEISSHARRRLGGTVVSEPQIFLHPTTQLRHGVLLPEKRDPGGQVNPFARKIIARRKTGYNVR